MRPKGPEKGIMVSGFWTPGGVLCVPDSYSDAELLAIPNFPRETVDKKVRLIRSALKMFEYGKNAQGYWRGEDMVAQTIKEAIPIFKLAFPDCQALFAFDNSANHNCYAPDALRVEKMNKGIGGSQPKMRPTTYISGEGDEAEVVEQDMVFLEGTHAGQPKGVERVLRERGLWPKNRKRLDGQNLVLKCGKKCESEMEGGCCAKVLLSHQLDFMEQKGFVQEEVEMRDHEVLFYPKFHCELNFIEMVWGHAKWVARENCTYKIAGLRETIPKALASVDSGMSLRFFNHCLRILHTYQEGEIYGTASFKEKVHKNHRQVQDKSKW